MKSNVSKACDTATADKGKVRLGDSAPAFNDGSISRELKPSKRLADAAGTTDTGQVRLGDSAPAF